MTTPRRVRITEFGETAEEALEKFAEIAAWDGPNKVELKPTDVIINVRSSSVLWVDVLMDLIANRGRLGVEAKLHRMLTYTTSLQQF